MSILSMHTATTGLKALGTEVDIIANNLANVNTTGFKRSRANFEDLLYLATEPAGGENSEGVSKPLGTYIGLGTRISNTQLIMTQGSPLQTDSRTDMLISGNGFFRVETFEEVGGGYAYTRNGNFIRNRDGELVLANSDGYRLSPPVTVPTDVDPQTITIGSDGTVLGLRFGETVPEEMGQVSLFRFPNDAGLAKFGMNLLLTTDASGEAVEGTPGSEGLGITRGSYLEGSNVDAVTELVNLIKAQRAFELNSQVITTGDEMLQTITHLK